VRRLPEYAVDQIGSRFGVLFLPAIGERCEISKISQAAGFGVCGI